MSPGLSVRILLIPILLALIHALSTPVEAKDNWYLTRERAMRLKENNRALEAYQTTLSYDGGGANMVDREFVAGWIALKNLGRPDIALNHFKSMAGHIPNLRKDQQAAAKSKTGYWLGRTLMASGDHANAYKMFAVGAIYATTFYGQLCASEAKIKITKDHVPDNGSFPVKEIYWHDTRAKKELVLAVIREESRFKQLAQSNKKAIGMMQVLDGTAQAVGKAAGVKVDLKLMRQSGDYNIAVGSRYLADQLSFYGGNAMLAVAAYNAGPQNVNSWIKRFGDPRVNADPVDWVENIPFKETREYTQKVIGSYITYLAMSQ